MYARGRSYPAPLAVLILLRRPPEAAISGLRIGYVVSKKQGKATVRNRIKRRLKEAVRHFGETLTVSDTDVVLVGRSGLRNADWELVLASIGGLLQRSRLASVRQVGEKGEQCAHS